MILHEFIIPYRSRSDIITIKPCFDWHVGNKYCDERAIRHYLSERDENTYLIGGGDLIDAVITKDIKRYMKHTDDTKGDDIIDEQIDRLYSLVKEYEDGHIIGLGTGNHESTILKHHGTHPIRRLAKQLNTVSLGFSWMVRLRFRKYGKKGDLQGNVRTIVIRGHHGWGGGSRTQGADLTKYSKDITYWSADMFLYGHVHRRQSDKIDRLAWIGSKLISKPKHIFICGTFLKTLSNTDEPTYSEEKGYPPVSIGGINIRMKPGGKKWVEVDSDV